MTYAAGAAGDLLERCRSSPMVPGLADEQGEGSAVGSPYEYPTRLQVRNTFVHLRDEEDLLQERKVRSCPASRAGSPRGCARHVILPRKDMEVDTSQLPEVAAGPLSRTTIYDSEGNSSAAASVDDEVSPDRDADSSLKPTPSSARVVHPWRRDSAKKALGATARSPKVPESHAQTDDLRSEGPAAPCRPQEQQPQERNWTPEQIPASSPPSSSSRLPEQIPALSPSSSPSRLARQMKPMHQPLLLSSTPVQSNHPLLYMLPHHGAGALDEPDVHIESSLTHWQGVDQTVYKLSLDHDSLLGVFQCVAPIVSETSFGLSHPGTENGYAMAETHREGNFAIPRSADELATGPRAAGSSGSSRSDEASDMSTTEYLLPSKGSSLHAAGKCRPCAFRHTKGCENGQNCEFCHLCEPGEKKKRRKDKLEAQRSYRKLRNMPAGQCQQRKL
eukprot:TRINITY_DN16537_c0_g1_i1.p1 TRINITY_DN16537_c0_g1~~TRINITY_DN16537_c0_g1_i1.p1  ORF type:complete len:457 (+),score=75.58 TRINITY_DN16537_c0_g1_i1:35-1372(+)